MRGGAPAGRGRAPGPGGAAPAEAGGMKLCAHAQGMHSETPENACSHAGLGNLIMSYKRRGPKENDHAAGGGGGVWPTTRAN